MLLFEEGRRYCITTVCQKVTPKVLSIYFVQVLIWVQSIYFSQSDAPCTKKNCNYLQFSFFFFAEVRHTVKIYLVCRFIIIISSLSYVLGAIEQFLGGISVSKPSLVFLIPGSGIMKMS